MEGSPQAGAEVNAQLQRDFSGLEPAFGAVSQRTLGDSRIAVGQLSLTRSQATQDSALPDRYTQVQTAAVLCSDTLRFPRFELQPANAATKLLLKVGRAMLGLGDVGKVDFPAHPEFAHRYHVNAFDDEGTRWLFEDRLLAQLAGRPGLHILGSNGTLILCRSKTVVPRDSLQAFVDEAVEVFRLFDAAARRPGALNNPMRARPTDYELFVEKLGASNAGFKVLPAVTLAEAEAFLQLPPPRAIPPGIARYCKEQASPFVLIFGGLFTAVSVLFLMVGQDQIPWYAQIFLGFGFVAGVSMLVWALVTRQSVRSFLRHGKTGVARIEALRTAKSRIDGSDQAWLDLRVEANGAAHVASCLAPAAAIDRLKAIAAEKRAIPVLYGAKNPARVLVADSLVMARDLG